MVSAGLPQPLADSEKKNDKNKRKNSSKSKEHSSLTELKTLGHQLLSSRAHINNLPLLLTYVSPSSPPPHTLEALLSLQSFFTPLLPHLPSSSSKPSLEDDDPYFIYRTWLRSKFDDLLHSLLLITLSSQSDQALREVVLDTIMEFVKVGNAGRFHFAIYHKFLHRLVHSPLQVGDILLDLLVSKYFKYIDVCYFTYISLDKLASTLEAKDLSESRSKGLDADKGSHSRVSLELCIQKIHHILSHIPPQDRLEQGSAYEMWNGSGILIRDLDDQEHSVLSKAKEKKTDHLTENVKSAVNFSKKMRLKFSKAWLSLLRLQLPLDVYKEVLVTLHQLVIPRLINPRMLCDFLTRSYDIGGVISVMALSSLYILMVQHGLEYPKFYEKLYALLEPSIFMAKHRAKFFVLLDSCLKSSLLPAYLAAAFAKKLSRLALSVPPSGALVIIALVHNLLRRHPSINSLVHWEDSDAANKDPLRSETNSSDSLGDSCASMDLSDDKPGTDHFKIEESDPVKSHAMRSSFWEIDTLRHHYCPPVSRFVLSLENDLTVRAKTTEMEIKDFSSGSYATIFREEMRRRVKQVPLAFYKSTPVSLFSESDFPGWAFNFRSDEEPISSVDKFDKLDNTRDISGEHDNNSVKRQRIEGL